MAYAAHAGFAAEPALAIWAAKVKGTGYECSRKEVADKPSVAIGCAMTEKQGGSDLRETRTTGVCRIARHPRRRGGPRHSILSGISGCSSALRPMCPKALKERGAGTPVVEVMRTGIPTLDQRRSLDEALRPMQERRLPAIGLVDREGRFAGFVTPENVGELMMVQAARGGRASRLLWGGSRPALGA